MKPKFSIIVGVYNQEETLPRLIDSLNRQSLPKGYRTPSDLFDVHFCDDGSSDLSIDIIEQAAGSNRFKTYLHKQEHKGMRLARNVNQGIRAAAGEYCVFVMADSMLELDYLDILNEYVAPDRVICGVRVQLAKVGGKIQGVDIDWRLKKNMVPEFPTVIMGMPWLCLTGNGLTIPTEALHLYGGWLEEIEGYGGEDNEIVARLFYKGYLCWSVPDLRLYHFWHQSRDSNATNEKIVSDLVQHYAS